jgi:hypothetical protein
VWKRVRAIGSPDLEKRLADVAAQANGVTQHLKHDPAAALHDVRRLLARIYKVEARLNEMPARRERDNCGLLEGSS